MNELTQITAEQYWHLNQQNRQLLADIRSTRRLLFVTMVLSTTFIILALWDRL